MSYLSEEQINEISKHVYIRRSDNITDIYNISFDCGIEEYNEFLKQANAYNNLNISKTHLFFSKDTDELIGYITLCNDTIKLDIEEKRESGLFEVPFVSMPALKIGKLAVNNKFKLNKKGYGSFMIEYARSKVVEINDSVGIACRFITVDADLEYSDKTQEFYKKNGFKPNKRNTNKKCEIVSMRADVFSYENYVSKIYEDAV